ncbi:contractile injection system protein, VgrG/Pvc8 family [Pantoea sp. EA-12]|uniref:contractile injection system protein, VgrG/Pvc8 family n=1 Tax=Pantoea sp. EA-12 TaxID=3043303 RepID=UPI0024B5E85D|nr:contractile injection system protein, VgrG/Pvc8 family [Pantoea sp. EA-12]MDI9219595.1 contractile injection system protein, VgrG/Pvc8 family [Pantoea sp. EA-12]
MTEQATHLFSHSHHHLTVRECSSPLDVLSFTGHESLSEPFNWHITFTSVDKQLGRDAMLLKTAALTLKTSAVQATYLPEAEPLRVVQGVVTGFEALGVSADEARYAITLQPRLALLARTRQNAIWQDKSVPQIVESILRDRHGMRGQDFIFNLSRDYPVAPGQAFTRSSAGKTRLTDASSTGTDPKSAGKQHPRLCRLS